MFHDGLYTCVLYVFLSQVFLLVVRGAAHVCGMSTKTLSAPAHIMTVDMQLTIDSWCRMRCFISCQSTQVSILSLWAVWRKHPATAAVVDMLQ